MIHHIVMFRRKPDGAADPALAQSFVARMAALGEQIDTVRAWKFRANEQKNRPVCWDYVLESCFEDAQGLRDYAVHPLHQALIEEVLKPYFEWAVVDYNE